MRQPRFFAAGWTLSADKFRELFRYDPETGSLARLARAGGRACQAGHAGYVDPRGYPRVQINRRSHLVHRLAFLYMTGRWPDGDVDHIDGNTGNNKWSNLRIATKAQNLANAKRSKHNTSGFKGVYFRSDRQKWCAEIRTERRRIWLGVYETREEAVSVRKTATTKYHGEFARLS